MTRIAVAGGAGAVGTTFVETLAATSHQVFVLGRTERKSDYANVTHVKIDYDDVQGIKNLLEEYEIETVLSAIAMFSEEGSQSQLNLISAAELSSTTKRFIPSEFGAVVNEESAKIDPLSRNWLNNATVLAKTNLKYTRIAAGFFMDFWGMPQIKTHQKPFDWVLNIRERVAAIPGNGEAKLSMSYTFDLAALIIRLLVEDDWPTEVGLVGQDVTFNQLVAWAEEATGEKFSVTYHKVGDLEKEGYTPLSDFMRENKELLELTALFSLQLEEGQILVPETPRGYRVNERFPDLPLLTVEAMIKENWTR